MKKLSSITCLLLLIISEIKSESVSCSSLEKEVGQEHITCIITDDINVVGVELSSYSDGSVIEIKIENNKNRFLPVKVAESFPNLKLYNAAHGSVESLSKENFKGLLKLEKLLLNNNKIRSINEDTFKCLTSLKAIRLDSNKIKEIHAKAFEGLPKLIYCNLSSNECLNENFSSSIQINQQLIPKLAAQCPFEEAPILT